MEKKKCSERHVHCYQWMAVLFLLLSSCADNKNVYTETQETQESPVAIVNRLIREVRGPLSISEYVHFLKQLKGTAYDEEDHKDFALSVLYKPQVLESAMSLPESCQPEEYKKILTQKSDYHYVLVQYHDKKKSVTETALTRKEIMTSIQQSIVVVINEDDTRACISELVSSVVMNQPDQLLLLVPAKSSDKRIRITLHSKILDVRPLSLDITTDQIHSFPALTL